MNLDFPLLTACNPRTCMAGKIMKVDRVVLGIYRKHLSEFDLTTSQLSIMLVLSKRNRMTQSDLSKFLHLEKSSMSRNMKRLFSAELITKEGTRQLNLTNKGKFLLEKLIPDWEKAKAEVNSLLGEDGQKALDLIVHKLTN